MTPIPDRDYLKDSSTRQGTSTQRRQAHMSLTSTLLCQHAQATAQLVMSGVAQCSLTNLGVKKLKRRLERQSRRVT